VIALDAFTVDEVGDVEDHLSAFREPATDLFIERHEKPVHLETDGAGAGLAFAGAGGVLAEIGEVLASNSLGGSVVLHLLAATVVDEDLEVHLGLAAEFVYIANKLALVGADGLAEHVVIFEYGSKSEGKHRGVLKAIRDDASVVDAGLLIERFQGIMFADDDCEITGGVEEDLIAADSMNGFEGNRLAMTG